MAIANSMRGLSCALLLLGSAGCTLVKPVVGAITAPFELLGSGDWNCGCNGDGRALIAVFAVLSAAGAVGGLVTGVISDVQVLTGTARHTPTANWWDPFRTNTSTCR